MMGRFIRFLFALFIIALGIVLVLGNLGFETIDPKSAWGLFFPVIFIGLGVMWIWRGIRRRNYTWISGLFFLSYGALLLLGRFDIIEFTMKDIWKLWPIIIIYVGFLFLGGVFTNRTIHVGGKGKRKRNSTNTNSFSFGDHEYNQENWKVEPMKISNLAGDFYLDFTKAFIPEEEIPIIIDALAGDVHILIPQNVEFRVEASVSAGEINIAGQRTGGIQRKLNYETVGYKDAIRKINFKLHLRAGEIRVDKV